MEDHTNKERNTEYIVLSVITAILLFIAALFIALTASREADFSMKGMAWLFRNNPAFWLITVFTVLLPLAVYYISSMLTNRINKKQEIIDSQNTRIDHVKEFAEQLTQGNFEVNCALDENDILGDSLVNLRETLKANEENSRRLRKAEEERNWLAEGSAHFSELLRKYIHEPEELSFHVIKDLTKYVNAIQGGFYVLDDSDGYEPYFNLSAFFAYDRRKFADQKIKWGDGLIGTCALEKKTIHLKNVPEGYITVTSGLGDASPDNLVVVPMLYENNIYGVLEFATFNKLESNHIALIEKVAESIAATLSAIKTNLHTAKLLEESKTQAQILTSQEEEMRQNMEELQATQEESLRQNQRLLMLEETLKQNIIFAEFDPQGSFLSGNALFLKKLEYGSESHAEGKMITDFIDESQREWFEQVWAGLATGNKPYKGYAKLVTRTGKELWIIASLSNLLNEDRSVSKVVLLAIDATEEKAQMQKHEAILKSVSNTSISLMLAINGNLVEWNPKFAELFRLTQKELKSLSIFDLVHPHELESFNKRWDSIIRGNGFAGILKARTPKGEELWLTGSFSITENAAHETDHVFFTGIDISREKALESELQTALETLKKQERRIKDAEKEQANKLRELKTELLSQYREVEKARNLNEKMLDELADAVITTSQDNRIVFFNKAAEKLWNIDRDDVISGDIGVLFPESLTDKNDILGSFTRPGNNKITGKREKTVIVDKNGTEKTVLVLLTKARAENENAYMAFFQPV